MNWDPIETISSVACSIVGRVVLFILGSALTVILYTLQWKLFSLIEWPYFSMHELSSIRITVFFFSIAAFVYCLIKSLQEEYFLPDFLKAQFIVVLFIFVTAAFEVESILSGIISFSIVVFLFLQVRKRLGETLI